MRNENEIREMFEKVRSAANGFSWWDDEKPLLEAVKTALDWVLGADVELLEFPDPDYELPDLED